MNDQSSKIPDFYKNYPFPNIKIAKRSDLYNTLIYNLVYGLTKKYLDKYQGKKIKILDIGCGTGELPLGLAKLNCQIAAVDLNDNSLNVARLRAKNFSIRNINFKKADFVKDKFPLNYYDVVFSIGVLHHLKNPEENFEKLTKLVKVGGLIVIGIYNPYGSFKVRIIRGILKILAGENFDKKIEIYRKLFYRRPLTETEKVAMADAFANPYRRYYTFEALLNWFKDNNIQYLDSTPPIELSKNIKLTIKVLKNRIEGKKLNLMRQWQDMTYQSGETNGWEIIKPISMLTQLSWVVPGRGELINLVGRRLK